MSDELYKLGSSGANSSNIASGYRSLGSAITTGWMNDGGIEIISEEDIKVESDGDLIVFAGKAHNGMATTQTTFLAASSAGYTQLLTGAGIALGVPPVAIPSTVVALCKTDTDACLGLPGDLADDLEDMEETMTQERQETSLSEAEMEEKLLRETIKPVCGWLVCYEVGTKFLLLLQREDKGVVNGKI